MAEIEQQRHEEILGKLNVIADHIISLERTLWALLVELRPDKNFPQQSGKM